MTETPGVTANPVVVPVPESATACGLPEALSVIAIDELRNPVVLGVNVTLMVQELLGARAEPQLLFWVKSVAFPPETVMELMVSDAAPTFVNFTDCAVLVV